MSYPAPPRQSKSSSCTSNTLSIGRSGPEHEDEPLAGPRMEPNEAIRGDCENVLLSQKHGAPGRDPWRGARHESGIAEVGLAGSLRGGCLPPPSFASAAVWPIANRPQLIKLPHNGRQDTRGLHFDVAHPEIGRASCR